MTRYIDQSGRRSGTEFRYRQQFLTDTPESRYTRTPKAKRKVVEQLIKELDRDIRKLRKPK